MSQHLWDNNKRVKVQKAISYIISTLIKNQNEFSENFGFTIWQHWLAVSSKDKNMTYRDIRYIILKMAEDNKKSIDYFELLFEELMNNTESSKHVKWTFVIPIYIRISTYYTEPIKTPIQVKIYSNIIKIIKWNTVFKRFGKRRIYQEFQLFQRLQRLHRRMNEPGDGYVITIVSEGTNNIEDAWVAIQPSFEIFMGILDLSSHICRQFHQPGIRNWRLFPTAPWLFGFSSENECKLLSFIMDQQYSQTSETIQKYHLDQVYMIAKFFRQRPSENSTLHLIAQCLRLYAQAMEETLDHRRLLAFWQIAECITRADDRGGDTKIVYNRLPVLLPSRYGDKEIHEYILKDISEKRNNIVHNGIYSDVHDEHVKIIKFYCERAIILFLENKKVFKNITDIDLFYSYRTRNNIELENIDKNIINESNNIKRSIRNVKDYRIARGSSPF